MAHSVKGGPETQGGRDGKYLVALIAGGFAIIAAIVGPVVAFALNGNAGNPNGALTGTGPPRSTAPGPSPTTGSPTPTGSGPTSPGPAASFTRSVGITFSGIDFDSSPLGPGPNYINWQRYNYRLQGYGSVIVSRYPSSGALPTEAACRSWAQAHNSQILDGVNPGDRLCFITQDKRTVRFVVTDITDSAVEGQATVWNDGNQ